MAQVYVRKRFSNYLGEERAIDDIVRSFIPDGGVSPTPTPSVTPTNTPTPTLTSTPTSTPTPTTTPTPTLTSTPTNTPTPTITPTATEIPCDFTFSLLPTPTPTPTNTTTPTSTPTPTPTPTPTSSPGPAFDPDAQAFFDEIILSGGTLTSTEENAINQLVLDLKGYSLWDKMIGLYPVVSSGATIQSFNLKDPTQYNLIFGGTWTHPTTGANPGNNGYARTGIIPSVINFQASGSVHYSMYITEDFGGGAYDFGSFNNGQDWGALSEFLNNNTTYIGVGAGFFTTANGGSTKKNWLWTNSGGTSSIYRDGSLLASGAKTIGSGSSVEITISSNNNNGSFVDFSQRNWALASIGLGMDATDAANYNTAVVAYQTALSREN